MLSAPKVAKPEFKPVNEWGLAASLAAKGPKVLPDGIKFASVQSTHDAAPKTDGKSYLYFWPGGQTERAVIELGASRATSRADHLSVQVSPLTGRAVVKKGSVTLASLLEGIEKRQRATGGICGFVRVYVARLRAKAGFTLLEVMVALAILGAVLVTVLSAQGGLAASNASGRNLARRDQSRALQDDGARGVLVHQGLLSGRRARDRQAVLR